MATRTIRKLIDSALSLINVYSVGQTTAKEDTEVELDTLSNSMLSSEDEKGIIKFSTTDIISLIAGQSEYTIGESGTPDLNTVRPNLIQNAFVRSGDIDYPVDIIGVSSFNGVPDKSTSSRPTKLRYNPTVPNGVVTLYPEPNSSSDKLYITSEKTFTEPSDLTEELVINLNIPKSYFPFLKYILASELSIHFDNEKASVHTKASLAKRHLLERNFSRNINPVSTLTVKKRNIAFSREF